MGLFPRWSDTAFRLALVGLAASIGFLVIAPMVYVRTPFSTEQDIPVDQPVQFDHRHHVHDDGIDCRFCHRTVETAATAGVPSTEVCMGCHNQIWNDSPMLEPLRRSWTSGKPIPWNRVNTLPDFVYFDHSIHVRKGVGCATCHGRVDQMPLVQQARTLQMSWCLDCHRDPARNLQPPSTVTDLRVAPAGSDAAQARALAAASHVQSFQNCTACHR